MTPRRVGWRRRCRPLATRGLTRASPDEQRASMDARSGRFTLAYRLLKRVNPIKRERQACGFGVRECGEQAGKAPAGVTLVNRFRGGSGIEGRGSREPDGPCRRTYAARRATCGLQAHRRGVAIRILKIRLTSPTSITDTDFRQAAFRPSEARYAAVDKTSA